MRTMRLPALAAAAILCSQAASAEESQVARGKYLVTIAGCNDCHTPGYFLGKPDFSRQLAGSDVGFTDSGSWRLCRPQSHTGQGDRAWRLD